MANAFELLAELTTAARVVRTRLDQDFAPHGVTAQQAGVLLHMASGVTAVRELRKAMSMDAAGMTRLLDRLADRGLIERSARDDDRRALTVTLTSRGEALAPTLPPVFGRVAAQLDAVPPSELSAAVSCLRTISRVLDS